MTIKSRIARLEEKARPPEWPDVTIDVISADCRLDPPDPLPDERVMTVKAGSPGKPGETLFMEGS